MLCKKGAQAKIGGRIGKGKNIEKVSGAKAARIAKPAAANKEVPSDKKVEKVLEGVPAPEWSSSPDATQPYVWPGRKAEYKDKKWSTACDKALAALMAEYESVDAIIAAGWRWEAKPMGTASNPTKSHLHKFWPPRKARDTEHVSHCLGSPAVPAWIEACK